MIEPTVNTVHSAAPMAGELEFRAVRAAAAETVHTRLDVPELAARVTKVGLGEPVWVRSLAANRAEYLRRPELGRWPDLGVARGFPLLQATGADIGFVLADGLSPRALLARGAAMLAALRDELGGRYRLATPVIATEAGVALGDHIGRALGVPTVLVVIGERPGPMVADSLSIYIGHPEPTIRTDVQRDCVSDIRPPEGRDYVTAAKIAAGLVAEGRRRRLFGAELGDIA